MVRWLDSLATAKHSGNHRSRRDPNVQPKIPDCDPRSALTEHLRRRVSNADVLNDVGQTWKLVLHQ